jgi:RNA polymerase sigma factor (sigma-70 family)
MSRSPSQHSSADDSGWTSLHVERATTGDRDSLEWIVRRFTPLLLAQASYRLGPHLRGRYEPADLVHDVWTVTLPKLGSLHAREGRWTPVLMKYLSSVLLFQFNNLARRYIRRGEVEVPQSRSSDSGASDPAAATTQVLEAVLRQEREALLHETLQQLTASDQEVLLLRGLEQQPVDVIAVQLGLQPGAVQVRYHRALQRLRAKLPASIFEDFPAS